MPEDEDDRMYWEDRRRYEEEYMELCRRGNLGPYPRGRPPFPGGAPPVRPYIFFCRTFVTMTVPVSVLPGRDADGSEDRVERRQTRDVTPFRNLPQRGGVTIDPTYRVAHRTRSEDGLRSARREHETEGGAAGGGGGDRAERRSHTQTDRSGDVGQAGGGEQGGGTTATAAAAAKGRRT
jgi:hypothetical protein